jgi:hypothetical protein
MNQQQKAVLDNLIAALVAHKEGKKLEWRLRGEVATSVGWRDFITANDWVFPHNPEAYEYRVKAEPRVIYINDYAGGIRTCFVNLTQAEADKNATRDRIRTIKFIEVMEEK